MIKNFKKIFNAIQNLPDGDVKRLTGNDIPPIYRIRISKYRILFHMNEEEIQILKVDTNDCAMLCGISAYTLNKIENGFEGVKLITLLQIMEALGMEIKMQEWNDE